MKVFYVKHGKAPILRKGKVFERFRAGHPITTDSQIMLPPIIFRSNLQRDFVMFLYGSFYQGILAELLKTLAPRARWYRIN